MEFFYDKYVRPGKPVVIKNAMKSWKAIGSWTDAYLIEKIGDKLMKVNSPYESVKMLEQMMQFDSGTMLILLTGERSYNKEFG